MFLALLIHAKVDYSQRGEKSDISLALVPRDHPVIPPAHLEAEASGLLDRLLSLLQENNRCLQILLVWVI